MNQSRMAAYTATLLAASFGLMACGADNSDPSAGKSSEKAGLKALSAEQRTVSEQPIPLPVFEDNPNPQGEFRVEVCDDDGFEKCSREPLFMKTAATPRKNDKISAIRNDNSFSVTFYADVDFEGPSLTLKPNESIDNLNDEMNDKISSWQAQVQGRAAEKAVVSVCTEAGLSGTCQDLPVSEERTTLNDQITSIQNLSDFDLVFYTEERFRGGAIKMPSRTYLPNLNPEGSNNGIDEKISSWQPESSDNIAPSYPN